MTGTYAVVGATGGQGGAVTSALRLRGSRVRAITRNPGSRHALALSEAGVEVVAADLDDEAALSRAFSGVDGVFAVTTPFEDGPDAEVEQGLHVIAAALRARVPHLVYASVASADQHTGIPHFDSKATVEAALGTSGVPYTIVGPTYFYDNLLGSIDQLRQGRFELPIPPDVPLQQLSRRDLGRFVAAILADPSRFKQARIDIASDAPTPRQMAQDLQRVLGRPIEVVSTDPTRIINRDMRAMFTFLSRRGYSADTTALRRDFPAVGWQRFSDWLAVAVNGNASTSGEVPDPNG